MKTKKYLQRFFLGLFLVLAFSILPSFASAEVSFGVCFGSGCDTGSSGGGIMLDPHGLPEGPANGKGIYGILSNALNWLLAIFGILGIVGFVISGIFYLVSAGDEGMADKGKDGMKWSIIGIIVGLSGYLIMIAISTMLNGQTATF